MPRRLALAAGSLLDADAPAAVDAAAAAGFDAVGLRLSAEHAVADLGALRVRLDAAGIELHDVEVHRIGTDEPGDAERLVTAAHAAGARHLLVVSDLVDPTRTIDELARLAEVAAAADLTVAVEYMAWTTPADPHTAIEVARATGTVVVVDVLHHARVGAGATELAAIVEAGVLGWLQLCDAPFAAPGEPPGVGRLLHEARHDRLPPGTGELPLGALLAALPADTTVSVEVQSDGLAASHAPTERATLLYEAATATIAETDVARQDPGRG